MENQMSHPMGANPIQQMPSQQAGSEPCSHSGNEVIDA